MYAVAIERGEIRAVGALANRFRRCRPGYSWSVEDDTVTLVAADGTRVDECEVAEWLREFIRGNARIAHDEVRRAVRHAASPEFSHDSGQVHAFGQ